MPPKAKPNDFTGKERERLAEENAEAIALRAAEMSLATAEADAKKANEIIDATKPNLDAAQIVVDEIETVEVGLADEFEVISVVDDIQDMTFGAGNFFSFERGKKYQVTTALANHLREKGYVWG